MARTKNFLPTVNPQNPQECPVCHTIFSRKGDLPRHLRTHADHKLRAALSFKCPWKGCHFASLQKTNVNTHLRTHTSDRSCHCPEVNCDFKACDPGSLTRHRKRLHKYVPKPRKPRVIAPVLPDTYKTGSVSSTSTEQRDLPVSEAEEEIDELDSDSDIELGGPPQPGLPTHLFGGSPSSSYSGVHALGQE